MYAVAFDLVMADTEQHHPAPVSAISTSAGMPSWRCSLRIMANVSGRLQFRTS